MSAILMTSLHRRIQSFHPPRTADHCQQGSKYVVCLVCVVMYVFVGGCSVHVQRRCCLCMLMCIQCQFYRIFHMLSAAWVLSLHVWNGYCKSPSCNRIKSEIVVGIMGMENTATSHLFMMKVGSPLNNSSDAICTVWVLRAVFTSTIANCQLPTPLIVIKASASLQIIAWMPAMQCRTRSRALSSFRSWILPSQSLFKLMSFDSTIALRYFLLFVIFLYLRYLCTMRAYHLIITAVIKNAVIIKQVFASGPHLVWGLLMKFSYSEQCTYMC